MTVNDWIHVIAGTFILTGVTLGAFVNPYWYFLPAFVGANLLQYGFTKFCPLGVVLKKIGVPENR